MYGTIARMRLKDGADEELNRQLEEFTARAVPGFRQTLIYRMDADSNDVMMVVAFDDKESYVKNAEDPRQNEDYEKMRALLVADPEWNDGEIILDARP